MALTNDPVFIKLKYDIEESSSSDMWIKGNHVEMQLKCCKSSIITLSEKFDSNWPNWFSKRNNSTICETIFQSRVYESSPETIEGSIPQRQVAILK